MTDGWCSCESSCSTFSKHLLQLAAGSTLGRKRDTASNPPSQYTASPLYSYGPRPPGGSIPKPSGLLFKVLGEDSENHGTAEEESMRKAK